MCVCKPVHGKSSAGGQKRRWNDVLVGDLKSYDLLDDWRKIAQDRGAWICLVMGALMDINEHMEVLEEEKKDERKRRREEGMPLKSVDLKCQETGCVFVGQTKAGLVNHVRQRHGRMSGAMEKCCFYGAMYGKQGLLMHRRFCQANLNRGSTS